LQEANIYKSGFNPKRQKKTSEFLQSHLFAADYPQPYLTVYLFISFLVHADSPRTPRHHCLEAGSAVLCKSTKILERSHWVKIFGHESLSVSKTKLDLPLQIILQVILRRKDTPLKLGVFSGRHDNWFSSKYSDSSSPTR
jgi:hypothetical protein